MKNSGIKRALTKLHNSGKWFKIPDYRICVNTIIDEKNKTIYQIIDGNNNYFYVKFCIFEPIIFTIEHNLYRKSEDKIIERISLPYSTEYSALYAISLACKYLIKIKGRKNKNENV